MCNFKLIDRETVISYKFKLKGDDDSDHGQGERRMLHTSMKRDNFTSFWKKQMYLNKQT